MKHYKHVIVLLLCLLGWYRGAAQDVGQMLGAKPFAIGGTAGLGLGTYTSSGIDARERKFSYMLAGSPFISIYGVTFPFTVVVSDQQRGFRQPFNQYGISPQYKWVTVHAGWQSISWSPYTMGGYNFLGGGVELNPGKLRFGFLYGRFNKAIEETSTEPLSFQTPAYRRTGYSTRIGYGTELNHVDVTFLKAKDDITSLTNPPLASGLSPAENVVLGINSRFSILKHFTWDFDVAASIYTRDQKSDSLKNLELDKIAFIRSLITLNASTQLLKAAETGIGYSNNNYNLRLQYKRIDPDYKSMGAYYFETDVENYTMQGNIRLMNNLLNLSGSLGLQHDNLMNDKLVTSKRTISSLGVSYNKQKFGADVRYSNYGIRQDRGLNPVIDTFRVARTNYNVSTMLRYTMGPAEKQHSFILVANIQSLSDLNRFTSAQSLSNSKTANLNYNLSLSKQGLGLNAGINYTLADVYLMHTKFYGPSIGIDKQLLKSKLTLNSSFSYQQQKNNGINAGSLFNLTFNSGYRLSSRDAANLTLIYLKSNSKDATLPSFNEFRSQVNLTHSF
ncbi:hypothetical protein [Mucilaginibacter pedocola]|uniref:Outer membrane protein beta-barrel domain-containing protein n=1 Tax=Mucilaginibacter pedocola TaxID=1792845 RepID=A0A1S9PG69_9SPHI|nr:hypothetical protein [Mucilaginibacter pedocola]OOQ59548.1 hypothetical protein BC343_05095 [Mucilaginibacter pedocola]